MNNILPLQSKHGESDRLQVQPQITKSDSRGRNRPVTMDEANEPEIEEMQTEISASQKMLSAVSGSLLTSLLGNYSLIHERLDVHGFY